MQAGGHKGISRMVFGQEKTLAMGSFVPFPAAQYPVKSLERASAGSRFADTWERGGSGQSCSATISRPLSSYPGYLMS